MKVKLNPISLFLFVTSLILVVSPAWACKQYPFSAQSLLQERAGYGALARGGDPKELYYVRNLKDAGPGSLRKALESKKPYWIVFKVEGEIKLKDRIRVKSFKTIDGRGRNIIVNGELYLKHTKHVIISDITLTYPAGYRKKKTDKDLIVVYGDGGSSPDDFSSRHLWFNHLLLTKGNDGAIDIRGATDLTVSWSRFSYHEKAMLMQKDRSGNYVSGMRATIHHNLFDHISRRGPRFEGGGYLHLFNNYYYHWYHYAVNSGTFARVFSENNIYKARPGRFCFKSCPDPNSPKDESEFFISKKATTVDWGTKDKGYLRSQGDWCLSGAKVKQRQSSLVANPSYNYASILDEANQDLSHKLIQQTGPRINYCE